MSMSRQLRNLVESVQPPPAPVGDFVAALRKMEANEGAVEAPENAMFPDVFPQQGEIKKCPGTEKNEHLSVNLALEFVKV